MLSEYCLIEMCGSKTGNAMGFQMSKAMPQTAFQNVKNVVLMKNLDGKEVRYDERVFGRVEDDQGSSVASEGFFSVS